MIGTLEAAKSQSPMSFLLSMVAKNHLGEVAAMIISTLISHGRLSAKEISTRSNVPLKLVKSTLVSLIQLNCMKYWQRANSKSVDYTFDERGILTLLHSGEILSHINKVYDDESTEIIQNLMQVGHLRVADFLQSFEGEDRHNKELKLVKLYSDGWLKVLQPHDFSPLEDLWHKVYEETSRNTPRSATLSEVKRLSEVKDKAKTKLASILDTPPKDVFVVEGGMKFLNRDLKLRFNFTRFEKYLRTKHFKNLCKSRIGIITAEVYAVILSIIEKSSPDPEHYLSTITGIINDPEEHANFINSIENKLVDNKSITFKISDILKHLPKEVDLRNSILTHNFLEPTSSKKRVLTFDDVKPAKKAKVKQENGEEDGDDFDFTSNGNGFDVNHTDNSTAHSSSLLVHHLKLLSSSGIPFITEVTPGTYTVPFDRMKDFVKEYNYEALIKATIGPDALRIVRCVKSLKLSDEKTIANSVLLKEKTVRNELYKLVQLNVIEIQEIPRSVDRAASKTFFAFRYKQFNSYNFLKNTIIYNMASILQMIDDFKANHKVLLEKCEREDVKGHEKEFLLESELKDLRYLQIREINNIGRMNRLKSLLEIYFY